MGLFGFGGNKVDGYVKKLTNAYVQTHERIRMLELLYEMGTDEAILGILKRFTFRTEASIVDEDEKELAYKLLVRSGSSAILPIERFVDGHEAVYWPIKALCEIAGIDAAVDLLLKVLDRSQERSGRVNEQKTQLVSNLRDFNHPRVLERLHQLVADEDEDVRIMARWIADLWRRCRPSACRSFAPRYRGVCAGEDGATGATHRASMVTCSVARAV